MGDRRGHRRRQRRRPGADKSGYTAHISKGRVIVANRSTETIFCAGPRARTNSRYFIYICQKCTAREILKSNPALSSRNPAFQRYQKKNAINGLNSIFAKGRFSNTHCFFPDIFGSSQSTQLSHPSIRQSHTSDRCCLNSSAIPHQRTLEI